MRQLQQNLGQPGLCTLSLPFREWLLGMGCQGCSILPHQADTRLTTWASSWCFNLLVLAPCLGIPTIDFSISMSYFKLEAMHFSSPCFTLMHGLPNKATAMVLPVFGPPRVRPLGVWSPSRL